MLTPNWRPMTDATRTARVLSDESRSMRPHDGQVAMAIEGNAAVAADGKRPRWLASPSVTHLGTRTQSNDRRRMNHASFVATACSTKPLFERSQCSIRKPTAPR